MLPRFAVSLDRGEAEEDAPSGRERTDADSTFHDAADRRAAPDVQRCYALGAARAAGWELREGEGGARRDAHAALIPEEHRARAIVELNGEDIHRIAVGHDERRSETLAIGPDCPVASIVAPRLLRVLRVAWRGVDAAGARAERTVEAGSVEAVPQLLRAATRKRGPRRATAYDAARVLARR